MKTYNDYVKHTQKIADVNNAIAVLHWDKEVYLPENSAKFRTQQLATLEGISYNLGTQDDYGYLLYRLSEQNLTLSQMKNVLLSLKEYKKAILFDEDFIKLRSYVISAAFHAWKKAKTDGNWNDYYPALQKLVDIKIEEAEKIGFEEHPYDALLDLYEPNATTSKLNVIFNDLKAKLLPILKKIQEAEQVDDSFLFQFFNQDKQWDFGIDILKKMGYDFDCGRQDLSTHPFTTSFSPEDVRVTTRIDENNFAYMLWSTIHEGGHALYEQGLPSDSYGLPGGSYISLGIHESQSRLWENNIGRSLPYWKYHYQNLVKLFPEQLKDVSLERFYKGINKVAPNYIRTEADELHYHFHVLIRFEIERDLIAGKIKAKDLRDIWNAKYQDYLGLTPRNDKEGILQDIHWAHGSFGYFPTYSLGSFYAAQFHNQAEIDLEDLPKQLELGDSSNLLLWLRENIHKHGHLFEANEICARLTSEELDVNYFIAYVKKKYSQIYNIEL